MGIHIQDNQVIYSSDDEGNEREVYKFDSNKFDAQIFTDEDTGKQRVMYIKKIIPPTPKKVRKRKSVYVKKKAETTVMEDIKEDFKHIKHMTTKELRGLNSRYLEVKDNIKKWDLKHPKNRFPYNKLQKETEGKVGGDDPVYDTYKEAVQETKEFLCETIDRYLDKLEPIYWIKQQEEDER